MGAVVGVLVSVDANVVGVDGIVLASFGDTGMDRVQNAYPQLPIVGIAGAAACCLGEEFSIVTFEESHLPALHARAAR